MEGISVEALPPVNVPCYPVVQQSAMGQQPSSKYSPAPSSYSSLPMTPETPSVHLPSVPKYRQINGYTQKTLAYRAPEVVKKIFTGQLTPAYFNDVCYGKRATRQELRYITPIRDRTTKLWEPKQVSREKTRRNSIRDIQDASFRKQSHLEKTSLKKEKERLRKTEAAMMREAEHITRGLDAYLQQMDRQKQKYDSKGFARGKLRRKP